MNCITRSANNQLLLGVRMEGIGDSTSEERAVAQAKSQAALLKGTAITEDKIVKLCQAVGLYYQDIFVPLSDVSVLPTKK